MIGNVETKTCNFGLKKRNKKNWKSEGTKPKTIHKGEIFWHPKDDKGGKGLQNSSINNV